MSKASDHPKVQQVQTLLRQLIAEFELSSKIATEHDKKDDAKASQVTANRFWNALDSVGRA